MTNNKNAAGFYTNIIAAVLAILSVVFYLVNCNTDYFRNLGISYVILGCGVAAVITLALTLVLNWKKVNVCADILPVASCVLLAVSSMNFLTSRVNGIAGIMTFEGNASTRADMTSALIGIGCGLVALIVAIVASFQDVKKA